MIYINLLTHLRENLFGKQLLDSKETGVVFKINLKEDMLWMYVVRIARINSNFAPKDEIL
ncbi:hypothetical protein FACS1894181_07390 [Bacteroidia bacterium]|nr:hypothetical protein FACS1894181_07390 [Bacteroidia bacterium]